MMTIGSLFSGIGGLELGLERAGLGPVLWQCEIDPFCRAVLAKHWPNVTRFEDVTRPRDFAHVDIICGGFPCQDVSSAGKRRGIGGERSSLWWHFARVVEHAKRVSGRRGRRAGRQETAVVGVDGPARALADAGPARRSRDAGRLPGAAGAGVAERGRWAPEPNVGRVAHGVSGGLDGRRRRARLRALGNAVVPQCAEVAGRVIHELLSSSAAGGSDG